MKKKNQKKWTLLVRASMLVQTILAVVNPIVASAADIHHLDKVSVEYASDKLFSFHAKNS